MAEVSVEVWFKGRTRITVDTDRYPHYFEDNEARGGITALLEDKFYDEADLRGEPFEEGSTEFFDAFFDDPEGASDER